MVGRVSSRVRLVLGGMGLAVAQLHAERVVMVAAIPTTFNRLLPRPLGVVSAWRNGLFLYRRCGCFPWQVPGSLRAPLSESKPSAARLRGQSPLRVSLFGRYALALSPPCSLLVESLLDLLFAFASRHSVLRQSGPQWARFSALVSGSGKSAGRAEPIGVGCRRRLGFSAPGRLRTGCVKASPHPLSNGRFDTPRAARMRPLLGGAGFLGGHRDRKRGG